MLAFYSDRVGGAVECFDTSKMTHIGSIKTGADSYPIDQVGHDLLYVSTRGVDSVVPIEISARSSGAPIVLPHRPRSSAGRHSTGLALVAGADVVATSVINTATGKVVATVGPGTTAKGSQFDFGGKLASGHPAWCDDERFFILDRVARRIHLTDARGGLSSNWSLNTPSSVHHLTHFDGHWFALCEGSRESRIAPSVLRFSVGSSGLKVDGHCLLPVFDAEWRSTGAHHLTLHEPSSVIYVGAHSSRLHAIDAVSMRLLSVTDSGPGCGHVTVCGALGVATNHVGTHMTVIDLKTNRRLRDIRVSSPHAGQWKTQGHSSKWDSVTKRLYTAAPQDGLLLEIDPHAGVVTRRVALPGKVLIQGAFV